MEEPVVTIHGREYPLPEEFTMGELADIEEIVGQEYDFAKPGVRRTLALIYIAAHRADASVTVNDIRALKPDDFQITGADTVPLALQNDVSPNGSAGRSSDISSSSSEPGQDDALNGTGPLLSGIGAASDPETSPL